MSKSWSSKESRVRKTRAYISSLGMYVPEKRVTNQDLASIVETSDEWIRERTGISERRFVAEGQSNSDLSTIAAQRCLERAGVDPEEIDLIIVPTVTPDMMFPSTACLIQDRLGAKNAWGFDLSGACSGFLYGLACGTQFIETGACKKVLVVGTDVMSSIVDPQDRATCVLFGDGAGAVLLEPAAEAGIGIVDFILRADGSGGPYLKMPAGGSRKPPSIETIQNREHYVHQDGRTVFKYAVKYMADVSADLLKRNDIDPQDIKLFVPHQANMRIIKSTADRLKLRNEQIAVNIDRYANTTAATIPICLFEYQEKGSLSKGDLVVLASFGAGFTWGSILLRWGL
ncbi:MAG: ketoacyl-ACP synthase III [Acidobacteriota bacterium]|nr:MAG: ketoacyl-ACP synthase III [Acidobacteriota bacterium]